MNNLIIKLCVFEQRNETLGTWFEWESLDIPIDTNVAELKDEPLLFLGSTKESVVEQVKAYLKSKGLTGKLRVKYF